LNYYRKRWFIIKYDRKITHQGYNVAKYEIVGFPSSTDYEQEITLSVGAFALIEGQKLKIETLQLHICPHISEIKDNTEYLIQQKHHKQHIN
jgi:hypothetical protein